MARMTVKNIRSVVVHTCDGIEYNFHVTMTGYDSKSYSNYVDGKTTADPFPRSWLPVSVQRFLETATPTECESSHMIWNEHEFRTYRYK